MQNSISSYRSTFEKPLTPEIFSREEKRLLRSSQISRTTFISAIKTHLRHNIRSGQTIDAIAEEMCLSQRTLTRRLHTMNCQYRDIKDEVMMELSQDYLINTSEPIRNISGKLGYSDASNFCKAFKRWTGSTPKEYRNTHSRKQVGDKSQI
ncbi:MAG: hypothetical protein AseanaTS_25580 [Candidatus Pelagadaptatus aseana]|uniref:helix-turn-helix domain-containing protein n=1 Tax=Candidatus Pelagadaptatus aseana TaxID=3120508 RepID=UPI0039B219CC